MRPRISLFKVTSTYLFLALLVSSASFAGLIKKEDLSGLLKKKSRPTMQELVDVVGVTPLNNPYEEFVVSDERGLNGYNHQTEVSHLPRVIAFMEYMFPDALWAPLGRDAVIFGDLLDAFYIAIGQQDRVTRLNASGNTIRSGNAKDLVRFMESAGLTRQLIASGRPFVAMDRTGFANQGGYQSQSYTIMSAVYKAHKKSGVKPADLARLVNFFGFDGQTENKHLKASLADDYFKNVKVGQSLENILQIPIGNWMDSTPWHDTFGNFTVTQAGKYEGAVGQLSPIESRRAILGHMIWILQNVSNPKFVKKVVAESAKLGGHFTVSAPDMAALEAGYKAFGDAEEIRNAEKMRVKKAELEERLGGFSNKMAKALSKELKQLKVEPEYVGGKGYLSNNGKILFNWLKTTAGELEQLDSEIEKLSEKNKIENELGNNLFTLHFIATASSHKNQGHLTRKDYRRLLAYAFSYSQPTEMFFKAFGRIYQAEPVLRKTIGEQEKFFMSAFETNKRNGMENTAAVYTKVKEWVLANYPDAVFAPCEQVFNNKEEAEAVVAEVVTE